MADEMTESDNTISQAVKHVQIEGKDVYLVGTAHVSLKSVEDVRHAVETVQPDTICIELCKGRFEAITQRDNWKKMDIFKIIKETLNGMGIEDARVWSKGRSPLNFTIIARIKAAAIKGGAFE